jgi:hypothetical protein
MQFDSYQHVVVGLSPMESKIREWQELRETRRKNSSGAEINTSNFRK